jgi:hypothetical protein
METEQKVNFLPLKPTMRIAVDASFILAAPTATAPPAAPDAASTSSSRSSAVSRSNSTRSSGSTAAAAAATWKGQKQPEQQPPLVLKSSMHISNASGPKKPRKTVRYAFVRIYEHDPEQTIMAGANTKEQAHQLYDLTEYEAQRGPRRPPKFFQKSDQERQGLRKLREAEERQAEQEWRTIRQDTISIQEEASIMSAPGGGGDSASVRSSRSEASSFANASFYEGFEDRFKVKNKKKKSLLLGNRFGRFFRRHITGGRQNNGANSMIGEM